MAAYLIAHVEVTDPETFGRYREKVPPVIESFGGRYLIRGGEATEKEGPWEVPRLVVIEFPDMTAAEAFYHSPEYGEVLPLRLQAANSRVALVEGYTGE